MEGCQEGSKLRELTQKTKYVEPVKLDNKIGDNGEEWMLYLYGDKVMSVCNGVETGSTVVTLFNGGFGPKNKALVLSVLDYIL